jgi:hypothetical protein
MESKFPLLEAAMQPGTVVGWKANGSSEVGIVIGTQGRDVLVVSTFARSLENQPATKTYRDPGLTAKLPQLKDPSLERDVHRIPRAKVKPQGMLQGRERSVYQRLARFMQMSQKREDVQTDFNRLAGVR